MNGGSSAPYLARTPCVPLFCTLFNRGGNRRGFRLPGRAGIMSIVRWNLRPVIFGVGLHREKRKKREFSAPPKHRKCGLADDWLYCDWLFVMFKA